MVARSGILKRTFPVSINRVEATANQDLKVLNPFVPGIERYLQIMFIGMTNFILSMLVKTGTTVQSLKYEEFEAQPFPMPPLSEQRRIVAKVDELMGLCDRLEAARAQRESRRDQLTASTLYHLDHSQSALDLNDHAHFYLKHFPRLTTTAVHIQKLRQTILNLAVRGRLVSADPLEEAASSLLRKIRLKQQRLIEEGTIRKQKVQAEPTEEETPFALPRHWKWVRLGNIADVQDPNPSHRMPHYVHSGGVPFISSENFVEGDQIDFSIGKRVTEQTLNEQVSRFSISRGALAFTRIGTIGKSRFLPPVRDYAISHAVCVINPIDESALDMRFLRLAIGAADILAFAHAGTRSIGVPDLGMAVIRNMAIPFPPLAEQRRIEARVTSMMAFCDQLEEQVKTAQAVSRQLLEAVLHQALDENRTADHQWDLQSSAV